MVDLEREDMMKKPKDYLLRQYGDKYRAAKGEDGIWNLETRHKPRHGTTYEVYDYSDTHLAACLPPQTARSLLKRFPGVFALVQDADDAGVLVFEEGLLDELADALQLRRRPRLSQKQKQERAERVRRYRFRPAYERDKLAPESTITRPGRSKIGFQAGDDSAGRKSTPNAPHQSRPD